MVVLIILHLPGADGDCRADARHEAAHLFEPILLSEPIRDPKFIHGPARRGIGALKLVTQIGRSSRENKEECRRADPIVSRWSTSTR